MRGFAHVFVVATRDIVAGQELLIDYKESYWKERAIMERYMGPFRAAHQPEELDRLRAALVQRRGEELTGVRGEGRARGFPASGGCEAPRSSSGVYNSQ